MPIVRLGQSLCERVPIWVPEAARWEVAIYDLSLRRAVLALIRGLWRMRLIPSNPDQKGKPTVCLSQSVQYR